MGVGCYEERKNNNQDDNRIKRKNNDRKKYELKKSKNDKFSANKNEEERKDEILDINRKNIKKSRNSMPIRSRFLFTCASSLLICFRYFPLPSAMCSAFSSVTTSSTCGRSSDTLRYRVGCHGRATTSSVPSGWTVAVISHCCSLAIFTISFRLIIIHSPFCDTRCHTCVTFVVFLRNCQPCGISASVSRCHV